MEEKNLQTLKQKGLKKLVPTSFPRIAVGAGTCGVGNDADNLYVEFEKELKKQKVKAYLTKTGCFGFCAQEPLVNIYLPGNPLVILHKVEAKDAEQIVKDLSKGVVPVKKALCKIEEWDHLTSESKVSYGKGLPKIPAWNEIPFFKSQLKLVLRDCGLINPEDIEEYLAVGGYSALQKALSKMSQDEVIAEVKKAKLKGRGGAGFPTAIKWQIMKNAKGDQKYIICNADEGDPGAYMNRNEIESDPHMILEGMIIGAYATGVSEAIVYVRAEYPLAVERLKKALKDAEKLGLVGKNILNSSFSLNVTVVEGAGAFVCGEETSLIASIEGKAGRPRPRPPFPGEKGLWGKPTNINNVETWANIPLIIARGGDFFAKTGTAESPGTKVFSLVGKIKNTGLVELPLGTSLETIVYEIGEGTGTKRKIKAVQTGGPSGGCIPASLFKTPVDYASLTALGTIMGSGGMVVMDEDNCMVDVARYFVEFTTSESCGKCVPCRLGLYQAGKIITGITSGIGTENDLGLLLELGRTIKQSAFCGLGQTGPNPFLTTMKYFKDEYEDHIKEKRCKSGICKDLFLSPCENSCPLHINIPGFIQLLKEGKLEDAFESVLRDNPLPATTGRICLYHCKTRCRRNDIDGPVAQGEIHRYIADAMSKTKKDKIVIDKLIKEKLPKTGKKIAIVGAGPAGLTAAFYLVRLGHDVTIFDDRAKAGGFVRYAIPKYRLPEDVLDREIGYIKNLGVKFALKKKIGENLSLKDLEKSYDSIFLAIGAQNDSLLGIPGENLLGVTPGIEFLNEVAFGKKPKIGKNVVVIGGGNSAIDAARSALRFGSSVTIVYRREKEDMPANSTEIEDAEKEGVKFVFLAAPKTLLPDKNSKVTTLQAEKMKPGSFDASGRRRPVGTGEVLDIPCDTVILAIGEKVGSDFIKKHGIEISKYGTVEADKLTMKTNNPKIYAGGDIVSGPSNATAAMGAGKKAAESIDFDLMGEKRFSKLFKKFDYQNIAPQNPEGGKMKKIDELAVARRKKNFNEIILGLSKANASAEVIRCLRCDVRGGQ